MATEIGTGYVPVTFDKHQIGRELSSSIEHGARSSEGTVTSSFRRLAGLATAAFAGVQVVSFFKDSVEAARESNKVAAQTEAVIKSTGGAAGVTAKQFGDLAESISLKTGIDDEQIQTAENLIATFTNIKNAVGEGNDIFSQATQIAVDMGAALGGDASSNAVLLGKALNDPIRGLTALTRVGVTFTDEQREQIKRMQESGDSLGAQKIILAELNKEFGGSAEATATAGSKWGVFFGNLQEKVGNFLIPTLDSLATWAMTTLPDAFGTLQDAVGPIIEDVVTNVSMFWNALTTGFTEDEGTDIERFALVVRDLWPQIVAAFDAVVSWVRTNWPEIQRVVTQVLDTIVTAVRGFVDLVQTLWDNFGDNIMDFVDAVWPAIAQTISGTLEFIKGVIDTVLAIIHGDWGAAWDGIKEMLSGVWNAMVGLVDVGLAQIKLVVGTVLEVVASIFKDVWDRIQSGVSDAVVGMKDKVLGAWDAIAGGLQAIYDHTIKPVLDFIRDRIDDVKGAIDDLLDRLSNIPGLGGLGGPDASNAQPARPFIPPNLPGAIAGGGGGGPVRLSALGDIFDRATMTVVGEAGREVLLPMTNPQRTFELADRSGLTAMLAARGEGTDAGLVINGGVHMQGNDVREALTEFPDTLRAAAYLQGVG